MSDIKGGPGSLREPGYWQSYEATTSMFNWSLCIFFNPKKSFIWIYCRRFHTICSHWSKRPFEVKLCLNNFKRYSFSNNCSTKDVRNTILNFASAYSHTSVCQIASDIKIKTFYNYVYQSQILKLEKFCNWLKNNYSLAKNVLLEMV